MNRCEKDYKIIEENLNNLLYSRDKDLVIVIDEVVAKLFKNV